MAHTGSSDPLFLSGLRRFLGVMLGVSVLSLPGEVEAQSGPCQEAFGPCAVPVFQDIRRRSTTETLHLDTTLPMRFWVPDFVPVEAMGRGAVVHPPGANSYELSFWSGNANSVITANYQLRRGAYRDLFYNLLISIDPESEAALAQDLAVLKAAAGVVGTGADLVGIAQRSDFIGTESWRSHLGGFLTAMSVMLELRAASDQAKREVAWTWAGLAAFQEVKAETLAGALRASALPDDVIHLAFTDALEQVREERELSRLELLRAARLGGFLDVGTRFGFQFGLTKLALSGAGVLAAGSAAVASVVAVGAAAVVGALSRSGQRERVEASLILGTTLEREVLRPQALRTYIPPDSGGWESLLAVRRQLSQLLAGYALRYGSDEFCRRPGLLDPNFQSMDGTRGRVYYQRAQEWAEFILQRQGPYSLGRYDKMVVFILDSSGSMNRNDPQRLRVRTSELLVDYMGAGVSLGVVDFDSQARLLSPLPIRDDPEAFKALVRSTQVSGNTNITDALLGAVTFVDAFNVCGNPELILFTDGEHNTGPPLSEAMEVLHSRRWPVSVVGLSDDVNDQTLRGIARTTGGLYFRATAAEELVEYFVHMSARALGSVVAQSFSGAIRQGELKTESFVLDPGMTSLTASVAWPGSDLDLTLTDPSGRVYGAGAAGARHVEADAYEILEVPHPEPGRWTATVEAVDVRGEEPFTLYVGGRSSFLLGVSIAEGADTVAAGDPLVFDITVEGLPPEWERLQMDLQVLDLSRTVVADERIILAGSQRTSPRIPLPERVGEYELRATVAGLDAGDASLFTRELRHSFSVRPVQLPRVIRVDGGYLRLDWGAGRVQVGDDVAVLGEGGGVVANGVVISVYPSYSEVEVTDIAGPALQIGMRARVSRR